MRSLKLLAIIVVGACLPAVRATDVLTYHNDAQSTGQNLSETFLSPATVNTTTIRKLYGTAVDGQVYAQPLYKTAVNITTGPLPQQGLHDVVFVATEHDSLYAIDATGGNVLWQTSFLAPLSLGVPNATSITTMPAADTLSTDLTPEIGITSTPVIDPATGMIYVVAKSKQIVAGNTAAPHFVYTIFKVSIHDGSIAAKLIFGDTINNGGFVYRTNNNPAILPQDATPQDPFVFGTGDGAITVNGTSRVYFNTEKQMNRMGLSLLGGNVYLGFASHGDNGPYHGWVLGFDAATLGLTRVLNTTPNGGLGGIWQAGGRLANDTAGNIFFETGNGTFDALDAQSFPVNHNYGDCFVKVVQDNTTTAASQGANGWGLRVTDYFAPFNNQSLDAQDLDLGSGGLVILPDAVGSTTSNPPHPHLLIGAGKEGKVYLVDRDNMGKFDAATDHVVQSTAVIGGAFSTPAYFMSNSAPFTAFVYYFAVGDNGKAFSIANAAFSLTAASTTPDTGAFTGATPSVSANGTANGLVWVLESATNQLRAYNATNLSQEIWTSAQAANNRDALGARVKFTVPTVADGRIYVGTSNSLVTYGQPVPPTSAPPAPTGLTVAPAGPGIMLTWTDNANNEDGFRIEQSSDGITFAEIASVGTNSQTYTTGPLSAANVYYFRVRAFNSFNTVSYSAYSNIAAGQPLEILIPWNATGWAYMNPMGGAAGTLPNRADGTPDPNFYTTWYLPQSVFPAQYDGPAFGASPALTGTPGNAATYDSGTGAGPLGFAVMDYWATAGAEFTGWATTLTTPTSGQRWTGYFRKTFTVPAGGELKPTFRYLFDDGAYIYLDGVLIATVNIPTDPNDATIPIADTFTQLTTAVGNELTLQTIDLTQPAGDVPNTNAHIWVPQANLSAGTHTIAVSVHQTNTTSSDLGLSLELSAEPLPKVSIAATDATAQEATADTGTFTLSRIGNTDSALAVALQTVSGAGQAAPGTRYNLSPAGGIATIPVGTLSTTVAVNPLSDPAVLGTQTVTLNLTAGTGYALGTPASATVQLLDSPASVWKIAEFGSLAAAQSPAAADSAKPAGDGITNLEKYALGLHPLTHYAPTAAGLPAVVLDPALGSRLTLTFHRPRPAPTDVSYFIEATGNLVTGPWLSLSLESGYPLDNGNGTETLKADDTQTTGGAARRFLHLRITQP